MLRAGGSDYPISLYKSRCGYDKIDPYNAAFKRLDDLLGDGKNCGKT